MTRRKTEIDPEREHRITMEIVVDAYDSWEQAMGWFYHLQNTLEFPFRARCIASRKASPLRLGEEVLVTGLPDEEDCAAEMFVMIEWQHRELAVPLSQIEPISGESECIREAVADWHYWTLMGYRF